MSNKQGSVKINLEQVYLVTGVVVAFDNEDGVLIAGMLSDSPFSDDEVENTTSGNLIGSFAFTRKKAEFLRDRLNEFLQQQE